MAKILSFPAHRARAPSPPPHASVGGNIHLLPHPRSFAAFMAHLHWKIRPHVLRLEAPPKFPALPYFGP